MNKPCKIASKILELLGTPDGNCYIASEAFYHLKGGKLAGYKPVQGYHEGASHWWIIDKYNKVIDITVSQFTTPVNYSSGKCKGFLTKQPSKKAQKIINFIRSK